MRDQRQPVVDMPRHVRRAAPVGLLSLAILLAALTLSCGEAGTGVLLTIHSAHSVPEDVDRLLISLSAEGFDEKVEERELSRPFPHTVGLDLASGAARLTITIRALKGEREVSSVHVDVRPVKGEVVRANVTL